MHAMNDTMFLSLEYISLFLAWIMETVTLNVLGSLFRLDFDPYIQA